MDFGPTEQVWHLLPRGEALADGEKVRLISVITDTGIGMSKEFMERMFTKFERETDTRVNTISGYGLGLSIVKQPVDMKRLTAALRELAVHNA